MQTLFFQAIKFFGISGIGWLLDFGTYTVLGVFFHNLFLNNVISSWIGVTFTFVFSTRTVFKNRSSMPVKVKYLLYLLYQAALIFVVSKLVQFVDTQLLRVFDAHIIVKSSYLIAKILVTPVTMVLNFLVMKILLEKI